jgi:aromatic ring hydroxylase
VILWRNLAWLISSAMALDPEPLFNGMVVPKMQYAAASRLIATMSWNEIQRIFETTLGGAPLVAPSSYEDVESLDDFAGFDSFVEQRMSDYDLHGWTADPWASAPWAK